MIERISVVTCASVSDRSVQTCKETNADYLADLDSAIVDVQLFGSAQQIAAAQKFAKQLAEHRMTISELLASLRDDLREELELEPVEGSIVILQPTFDAKEKK